MFKNLSIRARDIPNHGVVGISTETIMGSCVKVYGDDQAVDMFNFITEYAGA